MDEDRFWKIVEDSRQRAKKAKLGPIGDFMDAHEQTLAEALRKLSPEEIVTFEERFSSYMNMAYRWDLWGAAYWLFGGCSNDMFLDFRTCLVSLGKKRFFRHGSGEGNTVQHGRLNSLKAQP
jgi:hypothetical protein